MTQPLNVLVVDDADGCRDLYTLWLEADHEVETVSNGTEALEQIGPGVDLVILDRNMPGESGLDVATETHNNRYDCQVVMISSEIVDFDLADSPVDEYLRKPVQKDTFQATVEQIQHNGPTGWQ